MLDLSADQRFAERLRERGKLRDSDLTSALRLQGGHGGRERLSRLMVRLGLVSERDAAATLSEVLELPLAGATDYPDTDVCNGQVSPRFLKDNVAVPIADKAGEVVVAMADPQDEFVAGSLAAALARPVVRWVGAPSEIEAAIERMYGAGKSRMAQILEMAAPTEETAAPDVEQLRDLASEAPVIRLVNLVIQRAADAGASDIHIEPFADRLKVRYRIDGVLQEVEAPPPHLTPAVISRVKLMSNLNIAERRLPQDGRIRLRVQGRELDVRVSSVPTMHGESVVLRLLNQEAVDLRFESLGFAPQELKRFGEILDLPHGMILVTGPTGSGKTTTLYTALHRLNTSERKILTVEDPVEYQLEGVNQIQVKPTVNLTFATALRSIVRQDPDVIMVGETRDLETARICVQSALTGHLVLSTLHTNDAASSVTRLLEMGVEDYLLTSTVNAVLGQRLVRILCTDCREPFEPLPETIDRTGLARLQPTSPIRLHRAHGCDRCSGTGYRGRTAIIELMVMSDPIRRLVLQHAQAGEIARIARSEGMRTMYEDGLRKVLAGVTTLEEVMRVTYDG